MTTRIIYVALGLLWSTSVLAQTASSVFGDAGLIGTWTLVDCNSAPAPENQRETITALASGEVDWRSNAGPKYLENVYLVQQAKRLAAGQVWNKVRLNRSIDQEIVLIIQDGRFRTMSTRNLKDGTYVVDEGVIKSTGTPTPWRKRCSGSR